jgi:hypothetical protein
MPCEPQISRHITNTATTNKQLALFQWSLLWQPLGCPATVILRMRADTFSWNRRCPVPWWLRGSEVLTCNMKSVSVYSIYDKAAPCAVLLEFRFTSQRTVTSFNQDNKFKQRTAGFNRFDLKTKTDGGEKKGNVFLPFWRFETNTPFPEFSTWVRMSLRKERNKSVE